MLADIVRLAERFNMAFSKLSLVNFISKDASLLFYLSAYQVDSLFKLANMTNDSFFVLIQCHWRRHSKMQHHHDLIKVHAVR